MVVTYYIKLFRMGADRNNGILMSLRLEGAETKKRRLQDSQNRHKIILKRHLMNR